MRRGSGRRSRNGPLLYTQLNSFNSRPLVPTSSTPGVSMHRDSQWSYSESYREGRGVQGGGSDKVRGRVDASKGRGRRGQGPSKLWFRSEGDEVYKGRTWWCAQGFGAPVGSWHPDPRRSPRCPWSGDGVGRRSSPPPLQWAGRAGDRPQSGVTRREDAGPPTHWSDAQSVWVR